MIHRLRRVDIELDRLPSRQIPVEDLVNGTVEVEYFIEQLRRPELRAITRMLLNGTTIQDVTRSIRLGRATVCRRLRCIRALCEHMGVGH